MKILVCISSVPDTTSKINFINNQDFDKVGVTYIINPYDEFCLTKAIHIKESNNATITVINVGDEKNDSILRKALAIGADNAVRINKNPDNSRMVADCIKKYCDDNQFDLIFCGRESIDYNGGKVPGFLAGKLEIPFINSCIGLEINNIKIKCKCEIDNGIVTLEGNLPVLIAGQKGLVEEKELKIPSMRGIMTARTKPLEIINMEDISNNSMKSVEYTKPTERSECKIFQEDEVEKLVKTLSDEVKVI